MSENRNTSRRRNQAQEKQIPVDVDVASITPIGGPRVLDDPVVLTISACSVTN